MKPVRIQRKRTKGWHMPENTVYVGRPSKWGNPFPVGKLYRNVAMYILLQSELSPEQLSVALKKWKGTVYTREQSLVMYQLWLNKVINKPHGLALSEIKGKNLACWCDLNNSCHADILLKMANG